MKIVKMVAEFPVDAGMIGIIPLAAVTRNDGTTEMGLVVRARGGSFLSLDYDSGGLRSGQIPFRQMRSPWTKILTSGWATRATSCRTTSFEPTARNGKSRLTRNRVTGRPAFGLWRHRLTGLFSSGRLSCQTDCLDSLP